MARSLWSGSISFGLVTIPVRMFTGEHEHEVHFHQLNKSNGHRIRYKKVDAETDEEVSSDQIGQGYEVGTNEFLIMDDEELEAVELESNHTIDIDQFVPFAQIDKRYYDQPYYIVPNDEVGACCRSQGEHPCM